MKRKVKWKNVFEFVVFVGIVCFIAHDTYTLTIQGWITGHQARFTLLGFVIFTMNVGLAILLYEDLSEKAQKREHFDGTL